MKSIEQKVSETVLQKKHNVVIGGATYEVAPPSIATLILVSELVTRMPDYEPDREYILRDALVVAKDCKVLGEIVAVLVLGADGLIQERKETKTYLFGAIKKEKTVSFDAKACISNTVLHQMSPKKVNEMVIDLLETMEIADFFQLTASLREVNLIRRTKEAEKTTTKTETIASGR